MSCSYDVLKGRRAHQGRNSGGGKGERSAEEWSCRKGYLNSINQRKQKGITVYERSQKMDAVKVSAAFREV